MAGGRDVNRFVVGGWVRIRIVGIVALVLSAGVAAAQETALSRGAATLAPFKRDLQNALREGLANGPIEAVAACRIHAPRIAESHSQDGVRVGRTSDRLRNPANAGPAWVLPVLEAYLASSADRSPRRVRLGEGRRGYVEPIVLQPLCATCHGESIAPDLAARIAELYPQDRAVGFRVGDLRGVFWAEFPEIDPAPRLAPEDP